MLFPPQHTAQPALRHPGKPCHDAVSRTNTFPLVPNLTVDEGDAAVPPRGPLPPELDRPQQPLAPLHRLMVTGVVPLHQTIPVQRQGFLLPAGEGAMAVQGQVTTTMVPWSS